MVYFEILPLCRNPTNHFAGENTLLKVNTHTVFHGLCQTFPFLRGEMVFIPSSILLAKLEYFINLDFHEGDFPSKQLSFEVTKHSFQNPGS